DCNVALSVAIRRPSPDIRTTETYVRTMIPFCQSIMFYKRYVAKRKLDFRATHGTSGNYGPVLDIRYYHISIVISSCDHSNLLLLLYLYSGLLDCDITLQTIRFFF